MSLPPLPLLPPLSPSLIADQTALSLLASSRAVFNALTTPSDPICPPRCYSFLPSKLFSLCLPRQLFRVCPTAASLTLCFLPPLPLQHLSPPRHPKYPALPGTFSFPSSPSYCLVSCLSWTVNLFLCLYCAITLTA